MNVNRTIETIENATNSAGKQLGLVGTTAFVLTAWASSFREVCQEPTTASIITNRTLLDHKSTNTTPQLNISQAPKKLDYNSRYKRIAKTDWFKKAYEDKSVGEVRHLEA